MITVPVVMVSIGCSATNRHSARRSGMSADRMMSVARVFEKNGHPERAQEIYQQVLASNPSQSEARRSLENLYATNQMLRPVVPQTVFQSSVTPPAVISQSSEHSNQILVASETPAPVQVPAPVESTPLMTATATPAAPATQVVAITTDDPTPGVARIRSARFVADELNPVSDTGSPSVLTPQSAVDGQFATSPVSPLHQPDSQQEVTVDTSYGHYFSESVNHRIPYLIPRPEVFVPQR
ncbi:MAG: tetratricopeptide repeat protein [Planctomycetes bacterium]|nr:tetratricopeptide repeat protein [Planctomycetota bacterium]